MYPLDTIVGIAIMIFVLLIVLSLFVFPVSMLYIITHYLVMCQVLEKGI